MLPGIETCSTYNADFDCSIAYRLTHFVYDPDGERAVFRTEAPQAASKKQYECFSSWQLLAILFY